MSALNIPVLRLGIVLWSCILTGSKALYHGRAFHGSIILGDYLYIDGGEICTWNGTGNGVQDGCGVQCNGTTSDRGTNGGTWAGNIAYAPNNFTYSIDLTVPWNNQTVELTQIKKSGQRSLNYAALWADHTSKSFYSYGGEISVFQAYLGLPIPPAMALYQFHPSGAHGYWSNVAMPAQSNFGSISRLSQSASTSYDGVGFALGGTQNAATTSSIIYGYGWYDQGLIIWNSSLSHWHNVSSQGYSSQAPGNGDLHFVPSFGPSGLLFSIGGIIYDRSTKRQSNVDNSQVYIYEPSSRRWAAQSTSGSAPPGFEDGCMVGAQGENGTYELFVFGGIDYYFNQINGDFDIKSTMELGSVHVLSIPAFHWQKMSTIPDTSRYLHTCNAIGRQMIVVGGLVVNTEDYNANNDAGYVSSTDPWGSGIGVFDLNEMEWRDGFDPNAGPYKTPSMVSDYYASNPAYPSTWDDPFIKDWFEGTPKSASGSASNSGGSNSSGSNTGAIAGGVVGGIIGIALIAAGVFWLMKRSRPERKQQVPDEKAATWEKAELSVDPASSNHAKIAEVFESGGESRSEAPMSSRVAEVGGGGPWRYELPGHTAELPEGRDE